MSLAALLAEQAPKAARTLVIDIETSPALVFTYDFWNTNITPDKIVEPSRILCWAAKWTDSKRVEFASEFHDGRTVMIQRLWDLLNEADVLVTYNGVKFDVPHIMRTFIENGYPPPSPWVNIDLLQTNRKRFKFASNRLGYVTEHLGLPTKLETGVAQLWRKVLEGDAKAWAKFRAYNKQDVVVTELLYRVLLPWMKPAHAGLFTGDLTTCPACGSSNLAPQGLTYTKTAAWVKCVCVCGAWCKVLSNGQTRPI